MSDHVVLRIGTRDTRVSRDDLMDLPESVLILLFPNGVVLNAPTARSDGDDGEADEDDVYYVDFDAECLDYILTFFDRARVDFYGSNRPHGNSPEASHNFNNPLFHKQAIIVLREELEWFGIPSTTDPEGPATDADGAPNAALTELKRQCGNHLLARRSIFTALQRNVNRENNVAEQHLIDMLCMSGFSRDDEWGYRATEPNRCCISSIALVLLKTGISHSSRLGADGAAVEVSSGAGAQPGVTVNAAQLATAQKLLLFWRKPARKCWWDQTELDLATAPFGTTSPHADVVALRRTKVWARRVWTLELAIL